ncbi:MAG TPA: glutathione S-transferase family protein [Kofleriaceae bacterium]|nr:glutathione S-transferase family protein [Kofleriaceae bacterium]
MLKLYGFARVNKGARGKTRDLRVLWALEEIGLPYEIVGIDHPNHDLDSAAYRALNPFGQIPVIDDDGVVVSESGAILLYLARKTGKLIPRDLAGEAQVIRWTFAALNTLELPLLSLWFVNLSGGKGTPPSEALQGWGDMRLGQLDGWLATRPYVATDEFTVADIAMTHVLDAGTRGEMLAPYPNLLAYRARCTDRPAWKQTFAAYCERVEPA